MEEWKLGFYIWIFEIKILIGLFVGMDYDDDV